MLSLREVEATAGRFQLGPVSAELGTGVTALLGANGAGKSTLMKVMVGVLPARRGSVTVRSGASGEYSRPGYLPQDFDAPRNTPVADYLGFVGWCRASRSRPVTDEEIHGVLGAVGLSDRARSPFGRLSGGMRRRVGVAQAMLGAPAVMVLDEPTVGLDPVQRSDLRALVVDLARERAVIVSTHLAEDVAAVADRVLILADGRQVFAGTTAELAARGGASTVSSETVERGFLAVVRAEGTP